MYHARGCTIYRILQSTCAYLDTCQRPCLEQVPSSNRQVCCRRHVAATNTASFHHAQRAPDGSIGLSCCISLQSSNGNHAAGPLRSPLDILTRTQGIALLTAMTDNLSGIYMLCSKQMAQAGAPSYWLLGQIFNEFGPAPSPTPWLRYLATAFCRLP